MHQPGRQGYQISAVASCRKAKRWKAEGTPRHLGSTAQRCSHPFPLRVAQTRLQECCCGALGASSNAKAVAMVWQSCNKTHSSDASRWPHVYGKLRRSRMFQAPGVCMISYTMCAALQIRAQLQARSIWAGRKCSQCSCWALAADVLRLGISFIKKALLHRSQGLC